MRNNQTCRHAIPRLYGLIQRLILLLNVSLGQLVVFGQPADFVDVGASATNRPQDVRWVQETLNQIPAALGGPENPLALDGSFGPLTEQAIEKFSSRQLGLRAGTVTLNSGLFRRLKEYDGFADQTRPGEPIAWGARVTGSFKSRLVELCQTLEIDPNHMMAAIAFETAETFSPAIKNAAGSGATGLIQFMPSTAEALGTTTEQLQAMSAVEQLDYVEKYFQPYRGRCQTLSDVYMAILWPRGIGKPEDFVLFEKTTQPKTYQMNRGLDRDADGQITKQEAAALVQAKLEKGLKEEFFK